MALVPFPLPTVASLLPSYFLETDEVARDILLA